MPIEPAKLESLRIERAPEAPARRSVGNGWRNAFIALLLFLGAALAWYWFAPGQATVVTVAAARSVNAGAIAETGVLDASGYVVARRLATISSKVTGRIAAINVEEGAVVAEGEVLARLDDSTVKAQLGLAQRQLDATRGSLREVEVRRSEAQRTLERVRSLRDRGLGSVADLDAAEAQVNALSARLDALRGEIAVAEQTVALRRQDLDDLVIRAPFAGVIVSKDAQPGEMISPISSGGFTRTGICTIVDMTSREIEVDVNEAFINRVGAGQRTVARLDAYPDWEIPSSVINIVPTADRQRATVRVRIAFDELDPRVLPDMGVRVRFLEERSEPVATQSTIPQILVPGSAVRNEDGTTVVYVAAQGVAERRAVRTGARRGNDVVIDAGVRAGETVITGGAENLKDGDAVRVE